MEEDTEGYLSEDEHSPTDASEDSVEVRVSSITGPRKVSLSPGFSLPHKLRKNYHHHHQSTTPSEKFSDPTTGRVSPTARANRRKATEPRRLLAEDLRAAVKRPSSSDEPDDLRPSKTAKLDSEYGGIPEYTNTSPPSPGTPIPHLPLSQHPYLGNFVRPNFSPLLLPPAWPPVHTAQYPYGRMMSNMIANPMGLLPPSLPHAHYPLLSLMSPHPPGARPLLFRPPVSPPMISPPEERPPLDEQPLSLVARKDDSKQHKTSLSRESQAPPRTSSTQVPSVPSPLTPSQMTAAHLSLSRLTDPSLSVTNVDKNYDKKQQSSKTKQHPPSVEVSVVQKVGRPPSKFFTVDSLLGNDRPKSESNNNHLPPPPPPPPLPPPQHPSQIKEVPELSRPSTTAESSRDAETIQSLLHQPKQKQRNYKNMTRERRIEANARERTRVHTISAAFEKLRTAVPAYSHNQKLSKLSVLRIACSYILSLSRLAGHDYSEDGSEPSFGECVDLTTRTIQIEGKAKKKRDE